MYHDLVLNVHFFVVDELNHTCILKLISLRHMLSKFMYLDELIYLFTVNKNSTVLLVGNTLNCKDDTLVVPGQTHVSKRHTRVK